MISERHGLKDYKRSAFPSMDPPSRIIPRGAPPRTMTPVQTQSAPEIVEVEPEDVRLSQLAQG